MQQIIDLGREAEEDQQKIHVVKHEPKTDEVLLEQLLKKRKIEKPDLNPKKLTREALAELK